MNKTILPIYVVIRGWWIAVIFTSSWRCLLVLRENLGVHGRRLPARVSCKRPADGIPMILISPAIGRMFLSISKDWGLKWSRGRPYYAKLLRCHSKT